MLPDNQLSSIIDEANFLVPDTTSLLDYEWGGVALNDPSQGLQFQLWSCIYEGGIIKAVSQAGVKFDIIAVDNVSEASLAFNQNMRPNLAYVADDIAYLYWYNTLTSSQTTTELGSDVFSPRLSLDDSRPTQSVSSDIILGYVKGGKLCMRVQRDRYGIEYQLTDVEASSRLAQIGMSDINRFQFKMVG